MWGGIVKIAGSALFRYGITGVITLVMTLSGLWVVKHYTGLRMTATKYEQSLLTIDELRQANQSLVGALNDQETRHNEEIVRLNEDRQALDDERFAIQKRAFIEAGKLKQALEESKDANNWYNTPLPDSIKRLRDY